MMPTTRNKLINLDSATLADALLELAGHCEEASELVARLVATSQEKVIRFKSRLADLERSSSFYDWRQVDAFARELAGLLTDLSESVNDGKTGVELMALFFECDRYIFESCDDSSGEVGDVFREDAATLFAGFASDCPDKRWLGQLLVKLLRDDDYGVRDYLLESATDYLPTEELRNLIDQFLVLAEKETSKYRRRSWYHYVEQLADQLSDAQLFENARIKSLGEPGAAACLDIAGIYLKVGDPQAALVWIDRIKDDSFFQEDKRNQLLQAIYSQLGDTDRLMETAWKRFRGYRCLERLEELLEVIGHGQRDAVITEQVKEILSDTKFSPSDAAFLIQTGQEGEAEMYLLQSVEQVNGDFYVEILPLAKAMEDTDRHLAATMLYRSLLDSILRRGYSKSYHHGIRYLKKLDILSFKITDWLRFPPHEQYKRELRNAHSRKYSFWGKYYKE